MSEAPGRGDLLVSQVSSLQSRWRALGFIGFVCMDVMPLITAGGQLPGPIVNLARQQGGNLLACKKRFVLRRQSCPWRGMNDQWPNALLDEGL